MAELMFEIESLEGNFILYEVKNKRLEIAFNILHISGLEYFTNDFIVADLEIPLTVNRIEKLCESKKWNSKLDKLSYFI